jgi:lipopolysaccharide biosynthesis glycosyltransferase
MNLIYQYWDGKVPNGTRYSSKLMKEYADRIGADYLFEENPSYIKNAGNYSPHFGILKIIHDKSFEKYDKVLYVDCDVFPVDGLEENIFKEFGDYDLGICREEWQSRNKPKDKMAQDDEWARRVEMGRWVLIPRNDEGNIIIYNSGCIVFTKKGRLNMRANMMPLPKYLELMKGMPSFASSDQPYIHAHLPIFHYKEMDEDWNRYVHYMPNTSDPRPVNDTRTKTTKFVHIQLRAADHFDDEKLYRIINLPTEEWNLND